MSKISIHTEWQPLEEIILGDCYAPGTIAHGFTGETALHFDTILRETKEDLASIQQMLEARGITVRRPTVTPYPKQKLSIYGRFSLEWPSAPLVSRDFFMAIGETMIQTYGTLNNRYLEDWSYNDIFADYMRSGSEWISMPKPHLKWTQGPSKRILQRHEIDDHAAEWLCQHFNTNEYQPDMWGRLIDEVGEWGWPWELAYGICMRDRPLWHAASMIKCGDTLLYNRCGSDLGEAWMLQQLQRLGYKAHRYPGWGHIDGVLYLVRPGLYMAPHKFDGPLANWDWIDVGHLLEYDTKNDLTEKRLSDPDAFISKWFTDWQGYAQTALFDINGISLDENTVMFCNYNAEIERKLNAHGVEVIQAPIRHRYFWDNGLHCMTLDVRRRGGKESYFS